MVQRLRIDTSTFMAVIHIPRGRIESSKKVYVESCRKNRLPKRVKETRRLISAFFARFDRLNTNAVGRRLESNELREVLRMCYWQFHLVTRRGKITMLLLATRSLTRPHAGTSAMSTVVALSFLLRSTLT